MNIQGKVIHLGQIQRGTSQAGKDWSKQEFTIQFGDSKFPEQVTVTSFPADKIKDVSIGSEVDVFVNFHAKEYNGKWYNQVDLWKVDIKQQGAVNAPRHDPSDYQQAPDGAGNDLPF